MMPGELDARRRARWIRRNEAERRILPAQRASALRWLEGYDLARGERIIAAWRARAMERHARQRDRAAFAEAVTQWQEGERC